MYSTSDDDLIRLSKLKLTKYTVENFKKYWKYPSDFGPSRRKRIGFKTIIQVYEVWNKRLVLRLFYLEQGYLNLEIYRDLREVTRYLAGSNKKLINGISASMSGTHPYVAHSYYQSEWKLTRLDKYLIGGPVYGYYTEYDWVSHNDHLPLLKKTIHKYSGSEILFNKNTNYEPNLLFKYLSKYARSPIVEVITKMGLYHLLDETHLFRNRFDSLPKILGVEKQDYKYLRLGMTLAFVRKNVKFMRKLKKDEYILFWKANDNEYRYYTDVIDYSDTRVLRYMTQNNVDPVIYKDYLDFASKLGYELSRSSIRFPKNLDDAHNNASNKIKNIDEALIKVKFLERYEENKEYEYTGQDYSVITTKSQSDLIKESKELNHCVRTYSDRVAEGKTNIFFVRKNEELSSPFITVEVKDNRVIQARGQSNTPASTEVRSFIRDWSREKKIIYEG